VPRFAVESIDFDNIEEGDSFLNNIGTPTRYRNEYLIHFELPLSDVQKNITSKWAYSAPSDLKDCLRKVSPLPLVSQCPSGVGSSNDESVGLRIQDQYRLAQS